MPEPRYVACDPAIYAEGGFHDDPQILEQLARDHAADPARIETVATVYGAASYDRILEEARIFADDAVLGRLRLNLEAVGPERCVVPPSILVRIRDARILDRAIYVPREEGCRPLYETRRRCDRHFLLWNDASGSATALPDTHDYLFLSSSGTFNWGHWLVDDLARLAAVAICARHTDRPLCILLHGFVPETDRMKREVLDLLIDPALRVAVRILRPDTVYRAERLYFLSPVTFHPSAKHPHALRDLSAAADAMSARRRARWWSRTRSRPARLYVPRRPGRGRVPLNDRDVSRLIEKHGFLVFDADGASAREQIEAFAAAERVVGHMGAAMTNTLFCRPGTRILHLAPDTFHDAFYFDLAAVRGHAYAACYGAATDTDRPEMANYTVDLERLERALAWLCPPG